MPAQIQKVPATGARVGSRILAVMPTQCYSLLYFVILLAVILQNIVEEHFILGHPVHFVN